MRLLMLLALQATGWTVFGTSPSGAAAAPAVSVAPLGANEVLLEVEETGTATNRADIARVIIPVAVARPTAAEARKAAGAQAARIVDALRAAGAAASDVEVKEPSREWGFVGNEAFAAAAEMQAAQAAPAPSTASYTVELRLHDPAAFERLRGVAEAAGAANVLRPSYSLADEGPAREAAKADAVRRARASAEAYARALGMRVGRILRVSERLSGSDFGMKQLNAMMRGTTGGTAPPPGQVETDVILDVDFALVPAR